MPLGFKGLMPIYSVTSLHFVAVTPHKTLGATQEK
jgi:hypothetical protein